MPNTLTPQQQAQLDDVEAEISRFQTSMDYWDCNCETHFIHKLMHRAECPKCHALAGQQPESRMHEIANLANHWLPAKLIDIENQTYIGIENSQQHLIITHFFDHSGGYIDEEGYYYEYDDCIDLGGDISVNNELYQELHHILTDPKSNAEYLKEIAAELREEERKENTPNRPIN